MATGRGKQQEPVCSKCGTQASMTPAGKAKKAATEAQMAQAQAKQQQAMEQQMQKQAAMKQAMARMQQGGQMGRPGVPPQMGGRPGMGAQGQPQINPQVLAQLAKLVARRGGR